MKESNSEKISSDQPQVIRQGRIGLALGMMLRAGAGEAVQVSGLWRNLIPVIAGNIVGGSVLVALVYYVIYRRPASNQLRDAIFVQVAAGENLRRFAAAGIENFAHFPGQFSEFPRVQPHPADLDACSGKVLRNLHRWAAHLMVVLVMLPPRGRVAWRAAPRPVR